MRNNNSERARDRERERERFQLDQFCLSCKFILYSDMSAIEKSIN